MRQDSLSPVQALPGLLLHIKKVLQSGPESFCRQFGAVQIALRQVHECPRDIPCRKRQRLRRGLAFGKFGCHAAACDRCGTSISPESRIADDVVPDAQPDLHALAATASASGETIRIGNALRIMGVQDVLDRNIGVYPAQSFP